MIIFYFMTINLESDSTIFSGIDYKNSLQFFVRPSTKKNVHFSHLKNERSAK